MKIEKKKKKKNRDHIVSRCSWYGRWCELGGWRV